MTDPQHVLAVKNDFHQKTPLDRQKPPASEIPKIARDDCQHFVRGGLNRDSERIPRSLLQGDLQSACGGHMSDSPPICVADCPAN
jgi:hypothetical protein